MRIGDRIKKVRTNKKMSLLSLSEKTNISEYTLKNFESNTEYPTSKEVEIIAKAFEMSVNKLLLDKEEVTNEDTLDIIDYGKEQLRKNIIKWINTIIIFSLLCIIIFSLYKTSMMLNIRYGEFTLKEPICNSSDFHDELKERINLILTHQGKYSDVDYSRIVTFVSKIKKELNKENEYTFCDKDNVSYTELLEAYDVIGKATDTYSVYSFILPYNSSLYPHIDTADLYMTNLVDLSKYKEYFILSANSYNKKKSLIYEYEDIPGIMYKQKYGYFDLVTSDIVKAGEIYE